MASLTEVYEGGRREASPRRLYLGVGLFALGAALTVGGIVVGASSTVAGWLGFDVFGAREIGGVLAGVGLPAAFLGVIAILPQAGRRLRTGAVGGLLIALVGVGLFVLAYPSNWYGMQPDYTLHITAVYFAGALMAFWCTFTAVANFKTRNDPGGTVKLEITKGGKTRVVEVSNDNLRQRLSGIGVLGATPDGEAQTQTNRPERGGHGGGSRSGMHPTASDGGATTAHDDAVLLDTPETPRQDTYCGNCEHFRYVRTRDGERQLYCGFHEETMEDMDPCESWAPNTG